MKFEKFVGFLLLLAVLAGCAAPTPAAPTNTPSPTVDAAATAAVQTAIAEETQTALNAQASATAEYEAMQQATATAQMNATATRQARSTQAASTQQAQVATLEASRTAVAQQATAQAEPMLAVVRGLVEDGYLKSEAGSFLALDDFDESWAQINWYQWMPTGAFDKNFVVRAQAEWWSASNTANWFSSGCGFVFRAEGRDDHYLVFLAMDGNVYSGKQVNNNFVPLAQGYYGRFDVPHDSAEIMLVVNENQYLFYVNGTRVIRQQDNSLKEGFLAYTLLSGTNKDFGTRCKLSDVEYWSIGE
ncbi:MAG: hypothetical protein OHK0052_18220 [Anaerolineales bacterium]